MWREVEDFDPIVGPRAYLCAAHVREKFFIVVHLWHELDIGASFNNRLRLRVEHNTHVVAVTHAQLLAEDSHLAIRAITNENGALGWSYHYS